MLSSRGAVTALVTAVLAACFAAAVPCAQAGLIGAGLGGYVTDADTGLGLGGASLAWNATTSPAPGAITDATGRYLFTGLPAASAGSLAVSGPAGWEKTTVGPITLPADDLGAQNVAIHRNWAAVPGGASTSANDGGPAGCEVGKATDNDRATGWSATVAAHTAADPAALTVAFPQTIDVRQLQLDPTAACGHDAGAALGAYRLLTSPDGLRWSTAAEGALGAAARGTSVAIAPTAGTSQVRYVRLLALAPQDPAAATVDVRELQVLGVGPNQAPTGSVTVDAPRTYVKNVARFRASFTDPDSTITRYLWDFDGDGRFEQATNSPQVAHVWTVAGSYHVIVGARDFRGGLGTTALDLKVIDPAAAVDPVIQRRPLITFDPVDGIDLRVRIACSSVCTFTAKLVISKAAAKAIKAKRRTILTIKRKTEGPGLGSWTIELPSTTIRRLRQAHRKSLKARLTASAVDQQKRRTTVHRWVTFR
jgi:PKD domain/F5/8 type C domain